MLSRATHELKNNQATHEVCVDNAGVPLDTGQHDAVEGYECVLASLEMVLGSSPTTKLIGLKSSDVDYMVLSIPEGRTASKKRDVKALVDMKLGDEVGTQILISFRPLIVVMGYMV